MAKERAGFNEVFVCKVCGACFMDRSATMPVAVGGTTYTEEVVTPHPDYPDIPALATTSVVSVDVAEAIVVPEVAARECCPTHTSLSAAGSLRYRYRDDAYFVVGARALE